MPRVRIKRRTAAPAQEAAPEPQAEGLSTGGKVAAGVAGLAGLLALRNPAKAWSGLKAAGRGVNALRMQLMLSGLALPKSLLGNAGATAIESIERGSMRPLKELFSRQAVRDFKEAWKTGQAAGPTPGVDPGTTLGIGKHQVWTPGRAMGAADMATRKALGRAGLSEEEAARAIFQTPLTGQLGEAFEGTGKGSAAVRYLIPFRRTPFNQLTEGVKTVTRMEHPRVLAGMSAAGAAEGARTADEEYPLTLPLAAAAMAKYGVPFSVAALIGRNLAGGEGGGGAGSNVVPISEWGIETGLHEPLKPFVEPSAVRAIKRIRGY